jgi:hypothetical protein
MIIRLPKLLVAFLVLAGFQAETYLNRLALGASQIIDNVHNFCLSLQALFTICSHYPLFSPMARFCILFANNHHYASSSDLLDIMTCQQKKSVSSILCTVQLRAGKLQF